MGVRDIVRELKDITWTLYQTFLLDYILGSGIWSFLL